MTALASTDVTVTVSVRNRDIMPGAPKLAQIASIVFGNGSLTYPTGGIPLPAMGVFGFKKLIEFGAIEQPVNGFFYKFDRTNHKMLIYAQGVRTGSTTAGDVSSGALAENSLDAETAVRIMGAAVDVTYDLGPLKEVPSTFTPAATTLLMLMLGE
jgi:hypothetical protein